MSIEGAQSAGGERQAAPGSLDDFQDDWQIHVPQAADHRRRFPHEAVEHDEALGAEGPGRCAGTASMDHHRLVQAHHASWQLRNCDWELHDPDDCFL